MELYSVGTCDKLGSHDGVLLLCASHANEVPKPAWPPTLPQSLPVLHPWLSSCFSDKAAGPQAAEGSFGVFRPKPAEDCSGLRTGKRGVLGCTAPHSQPGGIQVGGGKPFMDSVAPPEPEKEETIREGGGAGREPLARRSPRTPGAGPQVPAVGPTCLSCSSAETGTSVILPSPSSWEKWPWRGFGSSLD